jgi:hypothetical protein
VTLPVIPRILNIYEDISSFPFSPPFFLTLVLLHQKNVFISTATSSVMSILAILRHLEYSLYIVVLDSEIMDNPLLTPAVMFCSSYIHGTTDVVTGKANKYVII